MPDNIELTPLHTVDNLAAALEQDGFAYMPSILTADEVAALRDHIDALQPNPDSFDRITDTDKHIKTVFNQDQHFLKYLDMEPLHK